MRLSVSAELSAFIAARIASYAAEATQPYQQSEAPAVAEFGALPLVRHWFETIGLRPDGEVVRWATDDNNDPYPGAQPVEDRAFALHALLEGALTWPQLKVLIPMRPPGAVDCKCRTIPFFVEKRVVCTACGNVGWIPPADDDSRGTGVIKRNDEC